MSTQDATYVTRNGLYVTLLKHAPHDEVCQVNIEKGNRSSCSNESFLKLHKPT